MKVQMEIEFPDGQDETELEQLNNLLSSVEWSKVRLKGFDGGSVTTLHLPQSTDGRSLITSGYAFDHITLECSREKGQPTSRYQIETEYLPQEQAVSAGLYRECWMKAHPERQMMQMEHGEIRLKMVRSCSAIFNKNRQRNSFAFIHLILMGKRRSRNII